MTSQSFTCPNTPSINIRRRRRIQYDYPDGKIVYQIVIDHVEKIIQICKSQFNEKLFFPVSGYFLQFLYAFEDITLIFPLFAVILSVACGNAFIDGVGG